MAKNVMYQKLDFKLKEDLDFERLKGAFLTSYGNHPFPVISYYDIKDKDYLNSLLPDEMPWDALPPDNVMVAEVVVAEVNNASAGSLNPHVDHGISVCANYYSNPAESTTQFFKVKGHATPTVYPGKDTANVYTWDQVEYVDEFTASTNELYLFNVAQIHTVTAHKAGLRQFIKWYWKDATFDEIIGILRK
jgi:hypothetical protein